MITGTQRTVYYGSIMDKAERRERILNKDLLVPGTGQYAPGTVWMFSPYEGCTGEPVDCQCVVITDTCPGFTLFILQGWMAGWLAASSQLTKEILSCYLVGHWQYARPYIIRGTTTKDLLWLKIPVLTKFNHALLNDVPAVTQKHSSPLWRARLYVLLVCSWKLWGEHESSSILPGVHPGNVTHAWGRGVGEWRRRMKWYKIMYRKQRLEGWSIRLFRRAVGPVFIWRSDLYGDRNQFLVFIRQCQVQFLEPAPY